MLCSITKWPKRLRPLRIISTALAVVVGFVLHTAGKNETPEWSRNEYKPGAALATCTDNPYMQAMNETFDELNRAADVWLENQDIYYQQATDAKYTSHDHQRFFPFDSMGTCTSLSCIGGHCSADASKIVCGMSHLSLLDLCTVYSIGGNNHWEFELDILEKTRCNVHTFDCTGPRERFTKPANDRLHFHHICLGATKMSGSLATNKPCTKTGHLCGDTWTLDDMQSHLSHDQIDLLKIDIEGWEWSIFDRDSIQDVNLPMQLLMEVHYCQKRRGKRAIECRVEHNENMETAIDMARFQSRLLMSGYVVVNRDDNPYCPHCTELTLMRVRC
eukprot:CCRYP_002142-RA/>CCRYP_002142-RA protein AED:0.14 eAED:0.14 QI:0/-1/0/1/-1/1/1/0/330